MSDRVENTPGLTDYRARLSSESEVRLRLVGSYWFAEVVYEITLHPRPASPGRSGNVETDHPQVHREGGPLSHAMELSATSFLAALQSTPAPSQSQQAQSPAKPITKQSDASRRILDDSLLGSAAFRATDRGGGPVNNSTSALLVGVTVGR